MDIVSTMAATPDLAEGMRAMWQRSRTDLRTRIAVLEDAVAAASENRLGDEERLNAEAVAHKLIGTVGAFGFLRAATLAREIEHVLGSQPLTIDDVVACADHLDNLVAELDVDEPPVAHTSKGTRPGRGGSVLLVAHPDIEWRRSVARPAVEAGLAVVHAGSVEEVATLLKSTAVGAAVVAIDHPEGDVPDHVAFGILDLLDQQRPRPRIVTVGACGDIMDRVEASRRGVARFLVGAAPAEIVESVRTAFSGVEAPPRILMVDDDLVVLEHVRGLLGAEGFQVEVLSDPTGLWARLDRDPPDLIILDWLMPGVTGEELCRILRADPHWADVPVLVLTASTDEATITAAFDAGADDFATKPVVGPELAGRIRNRLERTELIRRLADRDPLTGLHSRRTAHRELDGLIRAAADDGRPVAVAVVEVDDLRGIIRTHGYEVGDRIRSHIADLLRRHFLGDELVSSWETGRFLVAMPDMRREDGVQRIAEALEQARIEPVLTPIGHRVRVAFSAGVAEFPLDGTTVDDLAHAADAAADEAGVNGGDRVLPAGWTEPVDREVVDVVLVEDDAVLGELLGHALTTRGLRFRWFSDGVDALGALVGIEGEEPELRPRVVVLDVGLPGVSGLVVLRRMAETGALDHTKVVMLTARAAEPDVVEALALGAVDHIAKPFSVPVLIERLRRHLTP